MVDFFTFFLLFNSRHQKRSHFLPSERIPLGLLIIFQFSVHVPLYLACKSNLFFQDGTINDRVDNSALDNSVFLFSNSVNSLCFSV